MTTRVTKDLIIVFSVHQYIYTDFKINYGITNELLKDLDLVYYVQGVKDATVKGNKIDVTRPNRQIGILL